MKKYSILIVTFIFSIGIFAQEENCPEPNKKAIKLFNAAKTGSSRERRTLILEAIKKDPNYLEAYDELAHMSAKRADRAFNSGDVKGYQQNNNQKIKYWKKI
ncbi:MAG: hypothetical protein JKY30_07820, partial [Flavobacteriales bacterium]|nr:hypothetical protein [Flavobacteriales bacterium]